MTIAIVWKMLVRVDEGRTWEEMSMCHIVIFFCSTKMPIGSSGIAEFPRLRNRRNAQFTPLITIIGRHDNPDPFADSDRNFMLGTYVIISASDPIFAQGRTTMAWLADAWNGWSHTQSF